MKQKQREEVNSGQDILRRIMCNPLIRALVNKLRQYDMLREQQAIYEDTPEEIQSWMRLSDFDFKKRGNDIASKLHQESERAISAFVAGISASVYYGLLKQTKPALISREIEERMQALEDEQRKIMKDLINMRATYVLRECSPRGDI
jgi:hypothetical protein